MTDKIKNFFEKRRRDNKFRGQGHRLNETVDVPKGKHKNEVQKERAEPCQEAKQAGLAALARLANKDVNSTLKSFTSQNKMLDNDSFSDLQYEEASSGQNVKEILAVNGVFFKCPLIGPEILPRDEWKIKIKEFLYEQLETEKAFTSCLIIHTLNKNKEKVEQCIDTLTTYLQNIIANPTNEKYKKIRIMNKIFQEKVSKIIGTNEFLEACGFSINIIETKSGDKEEFFVYNSESADISHLELMIDSLHNSDAIPLELDRNIQVLKPAQAQVMTQLPDEFYALTAEELKREQQKRTENLLNSMQLRTKAMREREEQKEFRKYRYSLIRVRFPDGVFLQGTFGVFERLGIVREFVRENLTEKIETFSLSTALGVQLSESDDNNSLIELKLVPAVMLTFVPENTLPIGEPYLIENI